MTTGGTISWNKMWTFIGVLGVPFAGLACWIIIFGTKLTGSVDNISAKQIEQSNDIKSIRVEMGELRATVDTIGQRQRDYQLERYYKEKFSSTK